LHNALGVALARKGDATTAATHFSYALLLRPDWADARLNFGLVLLNGGAFSQARVHLEVYLRQNPSDARAHHLLALALLRSGNSAQGLKELREAARLAPDLPETLNELAWLLATHPDDALRDGPEAVRLAERACTATGRKIPALLGTLAAACAEAGRFPDAINAAQEAISLASSSGDKDTATLGQELLAAFRAGRAYRQKATPSQ
jgi:tetratricopeptide (TPR) repeat protein